MIRPYKIADNEKLIEIFKLNTPKYFDIKEVLDFEKYLVQNNATYLTIEHESKIVGGTGYIVNETQKTGSITWIFFDPNFSGIGLGKKVIEHCLAILRKDERVEKLVVTTSQLAFKFFEKFGFEITKTEKNYWGIGLDLYQMEMKNNMLVNSIEINSTIPEVWNILTNPTYAKILGNELDKNAFLQSEWTLGAKVYFKYEPDKIVATGIITDYKLNSHIFTDYKEINYTDSFKLTESKSKTILTIKSGPYPSDYDEQVIVWGKWLFKVKELSEK